MKTRNRLALITAAAMAALAARSAQATTYTWLNPGTSGNLSDPTQWDNGTPASDPGTQLVFNPGQYNVTVDDNYYPTFNFNSIAINNTAGNTFGLTVGDSLINLAPIGTNPSISLSGSGNANIQSAVLFSGTTTQVTNYGTGLLQLGTQNFAAGSVVTMNNSGGGQFQWVDGANYLGTTQVNLINNNTATYGTAAAFVIGDLGPNAAVAGSGLNGILNISSGTVMANDTGGDLFSNFLTLNVAQSGTFNFNNNAESMGGISGSGNIILGTANINFYEPGNRTFTGNISGTAGIGQQVSSTLYFGGSSTYSGQTVIAGGGTLVLVGANAIPSTSILNVSNGSLNFNGFSQNIPGLLGGSLTGSAPLGGATLTIDPASGALYSFAVGLSGAGNLVINGPGTENLPGNNTYTGTTTVSQGTLRLNVGGLLGAGGTATVATGATLDAIVPSNATAGSYFNGTGNFIKDGAGTLTFAAANSSFTPSSLTVSYGTIALEQASDTTNKLGAIPVTIAGGAITVDGNASAAVTESFSSLAVGGSAVVSGSGEITVTAGSNQNTTLSLGSLTHVAGSAVDFTSVSNGTGTGTITASGTVVTNGILGGWATYNQSDFATVSSGVVVPLASYNTTLGAGYNTLITAGTAVAATTSTNSIKFGGPSASTVTIASGLSLNITSGGILVPASVGNNLITLTGGTLKSSAGNDLDIQQFNPNNGLTIASVIGNVAGTASTETATFTTSTTITVPSTSNLFVGEQVSATNLSSSSRIVAINSPTSITVSLAPTNNGSSQTLTFTPNTNLVKSGPGTLTLTASNTYNGGTYLNGGTISLPAYVVANLGTTDDPLFINGGTLAIASGSQTFNVSTHPITVGPAGATFNFAAGETIQGSGLFGTGTITLTGAGQLSVGSNASTFSGNIVMANGSNASLRETSSQLGRATGLFIGNTSAFQITDDATANFGIAPGAPVTLAGGTGPSGSSTPGAIVLTDQSPTGVNSGSGIFVVPNTTLTNPFTFQADTTIGIYNAASTSSTGNPLRQAQLTLPNAVTGAGNLIKVGSGVLVLSSPNNSFGNGAGTVIVGNGTLRDGVNNGVPSASMLQLGQTGQTTSGTFDLGGYNQTVAGFSTAGTPAAGISPNEVINSNAAAASTPSVLTTNIATGTTQTFSGQLGGGNVGSESQNGFSLVKTGLGTLTLAGTNTFNGSATVTSGALRIVDNGNTARPYAVADGATLIVTNDANATGPLQATSLTLGNTASSSLTFELNGTSVPNYGLIDITTAGGLTTAGSVNISVTSASPLAVGEFPLIDYTGGISGSGFAGFNQTLTLQSRAIGVLVNNTSNGSIDLKITGVDFIKYTGAVNGNWDTATSNFALNSSGAATTYRDLPSPDTVVFDDSAVGTHTVNLTAALQPASVTVNTSAGYTFTGTGSLTGNTPLTMNGPGTLTIATNDTNAGTTTINGGGIVVGNGTAAGSLGTGAIINNGQLTYNRSDGITIASNITGTGSFTHAGTGTITLGGANVIGGNLTVSTGTLAITGTTTVAGTLTSPTAVQVNGGGLQIGNGSSGGNIAADVALSNSGTLTFSNAAGTADANAISGAGNIAVASGSATLTGNVTYTGLTTLGSNTITYGSNVNTTLNNSITGTNSATIVKSGSGTLFLLGSSNGFTGTLLINQGIVVLDDLGASGDLGASSIIINSGTEFQFGPDNNPDLPNTTVVTINTGGVFALETGEDYGGIVLAGGTYIGGNGTATAENSVDEDSNFNLQSGSITSNGSGASLLEGVNPVDKYTTGTVTFSGNASVGTATPINIHQGILAFGGANLPTSGAAITLGDSGTVGELDITDTKAVTTSKPFVVQGNGGIINVLAAGGSLTLTGGISGGAGLTVGGLGTTTFNAATQSMTYSGDTTVTGGKLVLIGSNALPDYSNLNIAAGAVVQAQQLTTKSGTTTTVTTSVIQSNTVNPTPTSYSTGTPVPGGIFDLTKNDLVLHAQSLASVTAMVAQGYNLTGGGNWQGTSGITSSTAAADTSHLTAVGVISDTDSNGNQVYGSGSLNRLDGYSPSPSDVLVKYTYFGDANLDGKVDGSDYSLIDAGYASQQPGFTGAKLSGWYNGDFNYDGVIDGSDYALIDNTFNNQAGQIGSSAALVAAATAQVAGVSPTAVPEPASIGLLAAGVAGLVARRRR